MASRRRKKANYTAILIRRDPAFSKCPSCGKYHTLRRSQTRNLIEGFLKKATIFKPFRCNNCGWRGFKSTITLTWESVRNVALYAGFAILVGFIVLEILKRFVR
ncbi:MAG: hypothetical protein L6Q59_13900 [Ignavibacteriaceae bacterium]|nr:hypothetical protein [Ignavibacteriaceae bacterium]